MVPLPDLELELTLLLLELVAMASLPPPPLPTAMGTFRSLGLTVLFPVSPSRYTLGKLKKLLPST